MADRMATKATAIISSINVKPASRRDDSEEKVRRGMGKPVETAGKGVLLAAITSPLEPPQRHVFGSIPGFTKRLLCIAGALRADVMQASASKLSTLRVVAALELMSPGRPSSAPIIPPAAGVVQW